MAEPVKIIIGHVLLCAASLLGSASFAYAFEILPDPTRPASSPMSVSAAGGEPVLQSVLISPKRRVAIIDGETVRVGDRVGGARVVHISEGEVALANGSQSQVLKLYPGLEKRRTKNGQKP